MANRYNVESKTRLGVPGLSSGYDGKSVPDVTVPSVGIEDMERALFELFNSELPLVVSNPGAESKRAPVIFFAGERWALNKRLRALRDRNNALILPLITAVRTSVVQDVGADITGRGINQQTGELVIQRRLDKSDRQYQGLINRLLLQHQSNVAVGTGQGDLGQLTTLRTLGDLADDGIVGQGGVLAPSLGNNVYETIVVPAPQFYTATYEVMLWTQYTTHMNQLLETLIASKLPQGNAWRLETSKGYWFIAHVVDNDYEAETNTDDFSQEERIIKYKFSIEVKGYIFASAVPGSPVPIKRYVSSPSITFETATTTDDGAPDDPFLGSDDPTLPLDANDDMPNVRRDQRFTAGTRLAPDIDSTNPDDPAVRRLPRGTSPARFKKVTYLDRAGRLQTRLFRVKSVNKFTGETVISPDASLDGLSIVVTED